jgi:uncharacterized protein YukE
MRTHSDDVGAIVRPLSDGTDVAWTGPAADRFRERLADQQADVLAVRSTMLDAADALDRLADELAERQAAIERARQAVLGALDRARDLVGSAASFVGDVLPDALGAGVDWAQGLLDRASSLPVPGHPDWLDLEATL